LEFLAGGDVQSIMEEAQRNKIKLRPCEMMQMCVGVTKGMNHIASKRFIHMDLAARNVLLAPNNVTKITDFGLARQLPPGEEKWRATTVMKLPVKWCAVESIAKSIFSIESDVWACGVTIWEIFRSVVGAL
jgi:serine/threonine protein kinase